MEIVEFTAGAFKTMNDARGWQLGGLEIPGGVGPALGSYSKLAAAGWIPVLVGHLRRLKPGCAPRR